jgi:hypothetical protein
MLEPVMPTDLPLRRSARGEIVDAAGTLLRFYYFIGLVAVLLVVTETRLGMFSGLSFAESMLEMTGTDLAEARDIARTMGTTH